MEMMHTELVDWSRAQFALTALYHFLFVKNFTESLLGSFSI